MISSTHRFSPVSINKKQCKWLLYGHVLSIFNRSDVTTRTPAVWESMIKTHTHTPKHKHMRQREYLSSVLKSAQRLSNLDNSPHSPNPYLFSSLSFHRRKVIWHSKVICKGDWWLTIDVPILSRQRHFIQLCREYKHDRHNNGRITNATKRRGRSGGRQVTRGEIDKGR